MPLDPGFIRASGSQFNLNGRPFRVAGANNYYLGFASDSMVQSVFDLAAGMGLNVLRIWGFLDCGAATAGSAPANAANGVFFQYLNLLTGQPDFHDGPDGLERLDRTISMAEQYGIRLILALVNYWDDFGGVNQYLDWFALTGRDQFYRREELRNAYRNYVQHLLLRVNTRTGRQYRDEPAVMAWELANESRCVAENGNPLAGGTDTLLAWVAEMSVFIRSLDPNHLIATGDEGFFRRPFTYRNHLYNGAMGVDCERLLRLPAIDFGTFHLYADYCADDSPAKFGARWIREHIEAGVRANKPMLLEEFGIRADCGPAERDSVFRVWLDQIVSSEGAGAMLWMIAGADDPGQPYPDYDRYTVYAADEVPSVTAFAKA